MATAGKAASGKGLDRHSTKVGRGRGAGVPPLGRSTLVSLSIHLVIAALFVGWGSAPERPSVGSDEVDVDLVAPRLAPPKRFSRSSGTLGGGRRVGPERASVSSPLAESVRTCQKVASVSALARSPKVKSSRLRRLNRARLGRAETRRRPALAESSRDISATRRAPVSRHVRGRLSRSESLVAHGETERRPRRRAVRRKRSRSRPVREPKPPLFAEVLPEANPTQLLASFERARAVHLARLSRFKRAQRARVAKNARIWSSFVAAQRAAIAGAAQLGRGGHLQRGRRGGQKMGFKFYLSGRPQPNSKVVRPPELLAFPKVKCQSINPQTTPATVRMLVTMEGTVHMAYIKNSSRSRRFDRCALKQTKGMRFSPGRDALGDPLNVWIHVRVVPALTFVAAQ